MLRLNNIQAVCFDLDGTLADTAADLGFAAEEMMIELGLPFGGIEDVRDWVGDGTDCLIHRVLTRHLDGRVPDRVFNRANPLFTKAYQNRKHRATKLYPGAEACLERLHNMGISLACVTNKQTAQANEVLEGLGVRHYFSQVMGRDSVRKAKPSPDGLLDAADRMQVNIRRMVMVGDSVNDVRAARAAGCRVVAVSYGYNYGVDIGSANPDTVIDSLAVVPDMLVPAPTLRRLDRISTRFVPKINTGCRTDMTPGGHLLSE